MLASHDDLPYLDNLRNTNRNGTSIENELNMLSIDLDHCLVSIYAIDTSTKLEKLAPGPELDKIIANIDQETTSGLELVGVLQSINLKPAPELDMHKILQSIDQRLGVLDQLITRDRTVAQVGGIGTCCLYPFVWPYAHKSLITGSLSRGNVRE